MTVDNLAYFVAGLASGALLIAATWWADGLIRDMTTLRNDTPGGAL